jgi:hypothetical protein
MFKYGDVMKPTPAACMVSLMLLLPATTVAQNRVISGYVVERDNATPVSQVVIRIEGRNLQAVSSTDGAFRINNVPSGQHILTVEHIAYGTHSDTIFVLPDKDAHIQIRISRQAIQFSPIVVDATSELERRERMSGASFNQIVREQVEAAQQKGYNLAELLRESMRSVQISGERRGGFYCVEYRGGANLQRTVTDRGTPATCREVAVYLDGVHIGNPSYLYTTMALRDLERIEMLGPAEAGTRYGILGGRGVLLLETRQGKRAAGTERVTRPMLTGFDWSAEARPYPWTRVAGGSVVGSAIGLGVGFFIADQCLRLDIGFQGLRSKCSAVPTVGTGFLLLGLPAATSALAARWAGTTERSQGRVMPSALLGTLTVASGLLLYAHGETHQSEAMRTTGVVILGVALPVVTTFSDRIFRGLRN